MKYLKEGTILIPKPDKKHLFKPGVEYIVNKRDVDDKATTNDIGEYWMIKPEQSKP